MSVVDSLQNENFVAPANFYWLHFLFWMFQNCISNLCKLILIARVPEILYVFISQSPLPHLCEAPFILSLQLGLIELAPSPFLVQPWICPCEASYFTIETSVFFSVFLKHPKLPKDKSKPGDDCFIAFPIPMPTALFLRKVDLCRWGQGGAWASTEKNSGGKNF